MTEAKAAEPSQEDRSIKKIRKIAFEIHGNSAMFADPLSGTEACSYPAPPYSAAKAMIEKICGHSPGAEIIPTEVHICRPIQYSNFNYNCVFAAGKEPGNLNKSAADQRRETILINVAYKIHAIIKYLGDKDLKGRAAKHRGKDHAHYLQHLFNRNIKRGQSFYPLFLGRSEHVPTYFGPILEKTQADESINRTIPMMLISPWSQNRNGKYQPRFEPKQIQKGVMRYD